MEEFEIIFYETTDGKCPVTDFIDGLPKKMREKIFKSLDLLKIKGNSLREPYSKPLEDGIFELRCKVGSDLTRTLYFFYVGKKIIFTNGFTKKTRRTPQNEIELAKTRREDYIRREEEIKNENFRRIQERTAEK